VRWAEPDSKVSLNKVHRKVKLTKDQVGLVNSAFHTDTKIIMAIPEYIQASK